MGKDNIPLQGHSLFVFSVDNRLRLGLYDVVETQWFKFTIFVIIILSCIELATEGPKVQDGSIESVVQYYRCGALSTNQELCGLIIALIDVHFSLPSLDAFCPMQ